MYADGSGNRYNLENSELSYLPVTEKESSSGSYHGGAHFNLNLEKRDLIMLIDALERALWNRADHTGKRTMGSGTIVKKLGNESTTIYLKFRSDSMKNIEDVISRAKEKL